MEILDINEHFRELYKNEEFEQVIEEISKIIYSHPDYLAGNYLSFGNRFEKEIYKKYFNLDETLIFDKFNLSELFHVYALSFLSTNKVNEAKMYLKIANKINPVSSPVLIHLCYIYFIERDFNRVKEISNKILKFNYYPDILFQNYFYLLQSEFDRTAYKYSMIFESEIDFNSSEYVESLEKTLIYLNQWGIQIGYNCEIMDISKDLYDEAVLNESDDLDFLNNLYRHIYGHNSFLKGLALDVNLDNIIEEVRILIANNEIEKAISIIQGFLENDDLDFNLNYKIFKNEVEREFYYDSSDFDLNFILLTKHKNYYTLHYLYGFCLEKQEKYEDALRQYQKALEYNPYCIIVHTALIKLKLNHKIPIKIAELNYLSNICYNKKDLFNVYLLFKRYLEIKGRREDGDLIDLFVSSLKTNDFVHINLNAVKLLKENNFTIGFNLKVISSLEDIVKYYSENEIENLELYQKYLEECIEFNDKLSVFENIDLNPTKSAGLISELSEDELVGSFILIEDKFTQKYCSNMNSFKGDFDANEFDLSDSFVCYCYRQVTGQIVFLALSVSSMGDDLTIYTRPYFYIDAIIKKELLDNVNATILDDLTQFNHYIDTEDRYPTWIRRNLSGDKEIDRKFLLNELKNVDDDIFDIKKDAIGRELKNIVNPKELAKKEIPCDECICKVNDLFDEGDYKHALVDIDEFLDKFPPFYFSEYMLKYVYFDEFEREIYLRYFEPSERLINLHPSQNYCEIYNLKAKALYNLGKYDDAIDSAVECLKLNPINVEANIILSDAFVKKGNLAHSKNLLKEALQFSRSLKTHVHIYEKLIEVCELLNENELAQDLTSLVEMFNQSAYDDETIFKIKNSIIDDWIYFGFNWDMIEADEELVKINEKLYNGTPIDNILQQTKPLILNDLRIAYEELSDFISKNSFIGEYEIPYKRFEASLMYGDETDGNVFYNFENDLDYAIFKRLNPEINDFKLIPSKFKVCDLLNTYARALKIYFAGKSDEILKESLKLNPINSKTLLTCIDVYLRKDWLDEAKEAFDKLFELCYDKKILIGAYENLSLYYMSQGLKDTSKVIEEFAESLKSNSFENREYIDVFKKHNIPLGFNPKLMEIVKHDDENVFRQMDEFNKRVM